MSSQRQRSRRVSVLSLHSESMVEVDEDEVLEMKPGQLFRLAGQLGVDMASLTTLGQYRERILLHLKKADNRYFDLKREFGRSRGESTESTKQALDRLLDAVQKALTSLSPSVERSLRADAGHSKHRQETLVQQIEGRRQALMKSDCSVVVAGETSSGKSTFLNLLLGMDVLPTSILSCTAAVSVLRHSPTFRATLHLKDGQSFSQEFEDAASTKAWLEGKNVDRRQRNEDIRSIHVYLPAAVLQSGVTLVDTPGIGENEEMTRYTMNYIKQHSAAAYLYLIKTDNAGGIHEDILLEFLKSILHHNEQAGPGDAFNPSAAMFVCNRWDTVEVAQRDRVRENALHRLRGVWPRFQPSQVFFMSSTNAQLHFTADPLYVTEDYESVLRGLRDMYVHARTNAINLHYRWLKQLLHASTTFLQTAVHHCALSDDDLQARFLSTRLKLQALREKTDYTVQALRRHVHKATDYLCLTIKDFVLHDPEVKARLLDWSLQPLPQTPDRSPDGDAPLESRMARWKEEVDMMIMRRVMDTVDDEVRKRDLDSALRTALRKQFQEDLQLVDEEINGIQSELTMGDNASLNSSLSSNTSCTSTDSEDGHAQELLQMYRNRQRGGFSLGKLKHVKGVTQSAASMRGGAGGRASTEATVQSVPKMKVGMLLRKMKRIFPGWGSSRENPEQYIQRRSEKMVKAVAEDEGCLHQMVAKYHDQLDAFISDVESSIPQFIENNTQQMEDIRCNRRNYLAQRKELMSLMEKLEPVRQLLRGFGTLYIQDLTADNINFVLEAGQTKKSVEVKVKAPQRRKSLGDSGLGESLKGPEITGSLWTSFRKGQIIIESNKEDVMGRSYLQTPPEDYLIKEVARLRCLKNEHLAPFLGITRAEEGAAVFLFTGVNLRSARRFLANSFFKPSEAVPRIIEGVVLGLHYLHRQGLVHMELSQDTVMVNLDGEPRLCGMGLPRHALLPPDPATISADPFVLLSPEVLRGELYTSEDDVYSLGLLVWETCLHDKPYAQYRHSMNLQDFVSRVHPARMLELDSYAHLSTNLSAILRGCLLPARGLRMKTDELKGRVQELRSDPLVMALTSTHRRQNPVPRRAMSRGSSSEEK